MGYAREDSDGQTRDLYELLKSHLQVRGGVSVRYRVPCVVLGLCTIVSLVLFRGCALSCPLCCFGVVRYRGPCIVQGLRAMGAVNQILHCYLGKGSVS